MIFIRSGIEITTALMNFTTAPVKIRGAVVIFIRPPMKFRSPPVKFTREGISVMLRGGRKQSRGRADQDCW